MYDGAWPCQRLKPTAPAEACQEANKAPKQPSGGPDRWEATSEQKGQAVVGTRGSGRLRGATEGGQQATPTSPSPQEFVALSLHHCRLLIPAALARMGGNPTLEEIKEPEIAVFRITKRK